MTAVSISTDSTLPPPKPSARAADLLATGIFLALTIVFSLPWWLFARRGGGAYYIYGLMWSPALAAIATMKIKGRPLAQLGWRGARWRWLFAAYATILAMQLALTIVLLVAGVIHFPNTPFVADQTKRLHLDAGSSALLVTSWYILLRVLFGLVALGGAALGEEIGWRGFLMPVTQRLWGFTGSSLFVGFAWALWHAPLFVGQIAPIQMASFVIAIVGMSFVFGWFRLVSRSIWPCVVLHGVHNALITIHTTAFVAPTPGSPASQWVDEEGFTMAIVSIVTAAIFWMWRSRAEREWNAEIDRGDTGH